MGTFADAAAAMEAEVERQAAQLNALDARVTKLEEGGTTPPEPPEDLDWQNADADSKVTIGGVACTVEAPPRDDSFQMTADGQNIHTSVRPGENSNVGRARSEFRTNQYTPNTKEVSFDVVVGQSYMDTIGDHYNVHSQFHPNNDTENPSASINYQNAEFQLQTSEGTGSSIKTRARLPVKAGDRVHVDWRVTFGTSGRLYCKMHNLTTGEIRETDLTGVPMGKAGRTHNFKAGTYRSQPDVAYECWYYGMTIRDVPAVA